RAERLAAAPTDKGVVVVALGDERRSACTGGSDERLRTEVLLGVAALLARHARDAVGIADPAEAALDSAVATVLPAVAAGAAVGVARILRHGADRAIVEDERDRADLPAHARERPVARGRAADNGAGHVRD